MHSKTAIVHILGLLAMVVLISSDVSARVFTETFSNTKKDVENIKENKVSYGNGAYRGFGGVYPSNGGYQNNGGGYYGGYPTNGGVYPGYVGSYPINGGVYPGNGGYGSGYPINGGGYPGNGVYGRGYRGNVGGFNGNDLLGGIVGSIADFMDNIGDIIGGRGSAAVAVQSKDNTRN